jgi:hypothetical protein
MRPTSIKRLKGIFVVCLLLNIRKEKEEFNNKKDATQASRFVGVVVVRSRTVGASF